MKAKQMVIKDSPTKKQRRKMKLINLKTCIRENKLTQVKYQHDQSVYPEAKIKFTNGSITRKKQREFSIIDNLRPTEYDQMDTKPQFNKQAKVLKALQSRISKLKHMENINILPKIKKNNSSTSTKASQSRDGTSTLRHHSSVRLENSCYDSSEEDKSLYGASRQKSGRHNSLYFTVDRKKILHPKLPSLNYDTKSGLYVVRDAPAREAGLKNLGSRYLRTYKHPKIYVKNPAFVEEYNYRERPAEFRVSKSKSNHRKNRSEILKNIFNVSNGSSLRGV